MSALSDYLENELLDHICRGEAWASPADVWIALFTSDNGLEANAPVDEVTGVGYVRLQIIGAGKSFIVAAAGQNENSAQWDFAIAGGAWGTITHWAVVDAVVAGNVLLWTEMDNPVVIGNGDTFRILSGEMKWNAA